MKFLLACLSPAIGATVRLNALPADGCIVKDAVDTFALGGEPSDPDFAERMV